MKIFLVAGEASGDLHASHVVRSLRGRWKSLGKADAELDLVGWGGDRMEAEGMRLLTHYRDRAFMGLVEVLRNLRTVLGYLEKAKADIVREQPDMIFLVDNPGFNLKLAEFAKELDIPVHYYIAPKAWAWNEGRIRKMRKCIDALYVIFPFEVSFFGDRGMPCTYVGNPIFEEMNRNMRFAQSHGGFGVKLEDLVGSETEQVVLLMPGSRKNEVKSLLPAFIKTALMENAAARCLVAGAPGLDSEFYDQVLAEAVQDGKISIAEKSRVTVLFGATYEILAQLGDGNYMQGWGLASPWKGKGTALVASGTATLETALWGVPQVVAYQVNAITYWAAKWLVKLKWVSLVNILLQRGLVEEHLQDVRAEVLLGALKRLSDRENEIAAGYAELHQYLILPDGKLPSELVAEKLLCE